MGPATSQLPHLRHAGRGHLRSLDGIRGLAILMVLASHGFESNYLTGNFLIRFIGDFFYYGLFGVDLFFVLSGFLITGILVDSLSDQRFFTKFYARRILRIFPLYYGVLIALLLLTPGLPWHGTGWILAAYLQNFFPASIDAHAPSPNFGLFHFWSLAVEEQFYLVWPAIVFFIRGKQKLFYATLILSGGALLLRLALLAHGSSSLSIHNNTLCRIDSLLIGGALALLYRSRHWPRVLQLAPWGFLVATAILVFSIVILPLEPIESGPALYWVRGFRYDVLSLGFACLIAWALRPQSIVRRLFEIAPMRFLGKYSYGIYVLHGIFLFFLIRHFRAIIVASTHSRLLAVVGAGCLAIAISIVAAWLSYQLFEKHFLRLKRFFDYAPVAAAEERATVSAA
jgi:peptidoglycan/LPS O-acetylase OafA/YrhL